MRHFPDFLNAYLTYAKDDYCPDKFHFWTGVSLIAGALERKVWYSLPKGKALFPNLYLLLVATPGIGKSTAGDRGVFDFLRAVRYDGKGINFIPSQFTEAALITAMNHRKRFSLGSEEYFQTSSYLYASEASNTLKEIKGGGSPLPLITDVYDCGELWSKITQMHGLVEMREVCFNLLGCCTFSFLNNLVPEKEVMGGFASRLLYIVQDEVLIRTPQLGGGVDEDPVLKRKLIEDLQHIHLLAGRFSRSPEADQAYLEWFPKHDRKVQELSSERMQSFLARKHTNILKLAMVCSVSESDSLRIELRHWDRALSLFEEIEKKLPRIIGESYGRDSQDGVNRKIMEVMKGKGGQVNAGELRRTLLFGKGIESKRFNTTLDEMVRSGILILGTAGNPPQTVYRIGVDMEKDS